MQDQIPNANRPAAFEAHFRKECGMPVHAEFQWTAPYMVAALDGWNAREAHVKQLEAAVRAVLRQALDDVAVHPCDQNDDGVRAKGLYGPMADLYAALHSTSIKPT